jgi:hypothetical protein
VIAESSRAARLRRAPLRHPLARWAAASSVLLLLAAGGPMATSTAAESAAKWDLRDLYPSPEAWLQSFDRTLAQASALQRYKGTLGTSAA